jgi:quercetin dioxygenase-like cupin family protein
VRRLIVEVIERLDLSAMSGSYRGTGSASYHPALLLGILIYGYATGVFSSRKLERATYDSVAFRFIAANDHPDHECAELPDAGRFDPEFSTKQPLFTVSDWTREPVLQCKNDGRKRVPLVTAETCQTAAIKIQMVIYPPGTKSASYRHEGAESFIYLLSGRGTAGTHDQSSSVRKGDLIWFRDGEWHRLEAAADSEMRFLILYAPGVFRTAWKDPSKASAWSPTGLDINGHVTARDERERQRGYFGLG